MVWHSDQSVDAVRLWFSDSVSPQEQPWKWRYRQWRIVNIGLTVQPVAPPAYPFGMVDELRRKLGPTTSLVLLLFTGPGMMDIRVRYRTVRFRACTSSFDFQSSNMRSRRWCYLLEVALQASDAKEAARSVDFGATRSSTSTLVQSAPLAGAELAVQTL